MRVPKLCRNGDGRAFAIYPRSGGKREYFGQHGSNEAEQNYREWLTRVLNSEGTLRPKSSPFSVAELVESYLEFAQQRYSTDGEPNSEFYRRYNTLLKFLDIAASFPGNQIGPQLIVQFQNYLKTLTYTKHGQTEPIPYSRTYLNRMVKDVKQFVKWCCQNEHIPAETWMKLETVDPIRKGSSGVRELDPIAPVSRVEIQATLPILTAPVRAMAQVQYLCGMRPGEVCVMTQEDIEKEGDVWFYTPQEHKNSHRGKTLTKAIPKAAQKILSQWCRENVEGPIFSPKDRVVEIEGQTRILRDITHSNYGDAFNTNTYGSSVKRSIKKANRDRVKIGLKPLEEWSPNQLRHGIATELKKILGQEAAQDYLGHSNLNTTAIYAERSRERLVTIADSVEGFE